MKDYVRWSFVVLMIVLLVFMLRCAKQLDAHEVVEVYDGDTIRIDDGRNIRLIGVDAPEVDSPYTKEEPFGKESREHLRKLLAGGKVRIEVGPTPVDRYGGPWHTSMPAMCSSTGASFKTAGPGRRFDSAIRTRIFSSPMRKRPGPGKSACGSTRPDRG